jgi:porphobilinogen synthase
VSTTRIDGGTYVVPQPGKEARTAHVYRPRRLRTSTALRSMLAETRLSSEDMIYPLFVVHGSGVRRPIDSMPGIFQLSVDEAVAEAEAAAEEGLRAVLLFGIPEHKDAVGSESFAADGIVQKAVRAIKDRLPNLLVVTDVCLCEYTDHGHCGLLNSETRDAFHNHLAEGYVLNDETLEVLGRIAVSHAEAGADVVAPSGMMDHMVAAIRMALDKADFEHIAILSYAVKYASAYYGPFRDAAQGAPAFGDRKTHQMDPANLREAVREATLDLAEGADMLMVKPALAYLDVIRVIRDTIPQLPLVAYNVSGEYAMIKAAAMNGWLDERAIVMETLTGIRRAGADLIISYHARDVARWLAEG